MRATTPPATLVRLGEADVVRLCGLDAAAAGLELVARRAVSRAVREGGRLRAVVEDAGGAREVWVEPGETPGGGARWHCGCPAAVAAESLPHALGCAHVAAVLSAWIRHPADFAPPIASGDATPALSPSSPLAAQLPAQPPREEVTQPRLLRPQGRSRGPATLADELARLPAADLSALARRVLNADLRGTAEARAALDAALRSPAVLDPLLGRLDAGPRALLAQVLLLGGAVTAADLDGIATRSGRPASALHAEMAALARHGLVFAASAAPATSESGSGHDAARSWRQISGWRVPADLRPLLPPALPIPPAPVRDDGAPLLAEEVGASGGRPQAARVVRANPRPLLLALALLPRAPAPLNPFTAAPATRPHDVAPPIHPSATRAPFPLVPGDLAQGPLAALARGLGIAPGLAQLARRLLLWAREDGAGFALHDLARLPSDELPLALRAAWAVWRAAELPAELADLDLPGAPIRAGFDATHAALRPASLAAEVAGARDFTLRLLATAGEGAWYHVDDLLDLVWRTAPLFLRGRQGAYATPTWWLRAADDPRPLRPGVRAEWQAGEARFLAWLLAGSPHWLGALDLAYAPDGRLVAVRVTALGSFLLGLRETPGDEEINRRGRRGRGGETAGDEVGPALPATKGDEASEHQAREATSVGWGVPVTAGREGTLAAHPLAAGAELLDAIEVWARPEAVTGGRLLYRLAADRACAALDAGAAPGALLARLDALDARHGTHVAPAVRAKLDAWRAAYGASRIERGWTLIEARDAAVLAEALAASPEIAARSRPIAPAVALVPDDDAPELRAALARRGFQV
ncbi:MAG TPA: hypothetical protein VF116_01605 [Ktedonobacterales bacterium]